MENKEIPLEDFFSLIISVEDISEILQTRCRLK